MIKIIHYFFAFLLLVSFSCLGDDPIGDPTEFNNPPSLFTISVGETTTSSVELSWTESVDPEGTQVSYSIYVAEKPEGDATPVYRTKVVSGLTDNFYTLANMRPNAMFYVKIIADDEDRKFTTSETDLITLEPNQEPTDFEISVENVAFEEASFSWTESTDPDGTEVVYDLYLEIDDINPNTNLELVEENYNSLSYTAVGLMPNTNYFFMVKAKDADGLSKSLFVEFSTQRNGLPVFSVNNTLSYQDAVGAARNVKDLFWNAATDPEGGQITYHILVQEQNIPGAQYVEYGTTTDTNFRLTLDLGKSYKVWVQAKDPDGGSSSYTIREITVPASVTPPNPITGLQIDELYRSSMKISWNKTTDPDGDNFSYGVRINGQVIQGVSPNTDAGVSRESVWLSEARFPFQPNTTNVVAVFAQDTSGNFTSDTSLEFTSPSNNSVFKKITDIKKTSTSMKYTFNVNDNVAVKNITFPTGLVLVPASDQNVAEIDKLMLKGSIKIEFELSLENNNSLAASSVKSAVINYEIGGVAKEATIDFQL